MATLETSASAANPGADLNSQVPLDTIPISPAPNGGSANGANGAPADGGDTEAATARPPDDQLVTVFHDKDNFNVKHPLMNEWTLWFTKPPSGKVCYVPLSNECLSASD